MPMIDVGIKIEIAGQAGDTKPTAWVALKDCVAMPALIQPSAKIATNYIGDEFTGEMLGKRAITGLAFTFAYDGGKGAVSAPTPVPAKQFRMLSDIDDSNEQRFLRVTYPAGPGETRGTIFELLVECEVTLVPPTPSGEIDYTLSVTPCKSNVLSDLIEVVYPDETDPLE